MTARSSHCSYSAKFFLMKTPYFGGAINPKTYLNHELGSKLLFLSSFAYKLVKLLVFEEKNSCKMSKNWFFSSIICFGLNFTYEFEVSFSVHWLYNKVVLFSLSVCGGSPGVTQRGEWNISSGSYFASLLQGRWF